MNDELIVRVLSGSADAEEVDALGRWCREAPGHDRYVRDLRGVWAATAPPPPHPVPAAALAATIVATAGCPSTPGRAPAHTRWLGLAAAVAVLFLGVWRSAPWRAGDAFLTWEAGSATSVTATLPDGSLVRVAPGGRLRTLDADGERRYALEGGAFFAVAHDERRPFVIEAGAVVVRVVGTRFEIGRTDAGITTAVLDGRVSVSGPGGTAELGGGALAVFEGEAPPVLERPPDLLARLRRPEDALVFQGTPLARVAEDVARRFRRTVTVEDAALGERRVTGWFGPEDFEAVVGAVCAVVDAACTVSDTSASLRPR